MSTTTLRSVALTLIVFVGKMTQHLNIAWDPATKEWVLHRMRSDYWVGLSQMPVRRESSLGSMQSCGIGKLSSLGFEGKRPDEHARIRTDLGHLCLSWAHHFRTKDLYGKQLRAAAGVLERFDNVFGCESPHDQGQLSIGCHLDGCQINPLHVFHGASTTAIHFYNKFFVHRFSHKPSDVARG